MAISKKLASFVLPLAAGLVVATAGSSAFAGETCTPTSVGTNGSVISITCNGVMKFASAGVCGKTVETLKLFVSMAQSAILSGKTLWWAHTTECGITDLQLNK